MDDAINDKTLSTYFEELGNVLDKYVIKKKPQFIWNVDETGISLDHNPPKILARTGSNTHCVTSGKSATITVIAAVSALGKTITPYVIFTDFKRTLELMVYLAQSTWVKV